MSTEQKTINIPAPEFELYERVNLSWNGEHETKIVARWYDIDKAVRLEVIVNHYRERARLTMIGGINARTWAIASIQKPRSATLLTESYGELSQTIRRSPKPIKKI